MSNPNYIHTITYYHKAGTVWEKRVIDGVSWVHTARDSQIGAEQLKEHEYVVRIPVEKLGKGFVATFHDVVVLGKCEDEITGRSPGTAVEVVNRNKPEVFRVQLFKDNTAGYGSHYKVGA